MTTLTMPLYDDVDGSLVLGELTAELTDTDAGRVESSHPFESQDCIVRCVALATDSTYDIAHDFCAANGRVDNEGVSLVTQWLRNSRLNGYEFKYLRYRVVADNERLTPVSFVNARPEGRYILMIENHTVVCVDAMIFELEAESPIADLANALVRGVWEVTLVPVYEEAEEVE